MKVCSYRVKFSVENKTIGELLNTQCVYKTFEMNDPLYGKSPEGLLNFRI